ncbi:hypothetical protein [Streptomyces sp. TLI_146]|uniref:hypothetical protein n=1 Tax=Streptomyces sp. TLI_146 TaxID=1938858 RepID=UPI000C70E6E4|nr:hypothetical protein [Streptomyces sp. TLI_146]PKV90076.1 hypothetical protein BX283_7737 [Streptomyces sp. TLI_146]
MAAGASFLSLGTAHAEIAPGCGLAGFSYSTDGGRTWSVEPRLDRPYGVIEVEADLHAESEANCSYQVTLASYGTEGPTWPTSGHQTFLGSATVTVDRKHPRATLDVSAHMPKCYGQIDLYVGGEKYDGVVNPLPHYPFSPIKDDLLTAWNGGRPCEPDPTTPPVPTPTADPTDTPTSDPTPTGTAAPDPGPSTSPAPSSTATGKPSATPGHRESSQAPSPSVSVAAAPASPGGNLAHTGSNGGRMLVYGIGAATLLAVGAGTLAAARRRATHR